MARFHHSRPHPLAFVAIQWETARGTKAEFIRYWRKSQDGWKSFFS